MDSEGTQGAGGWPDDVAVSGAERASFDTSVAHIARVYDYWLGGKDNFAADRAAAAAGLLLGRPPLGGQLLAVVVGDHQVTGLVTTDELRLAVLRARPHATQPAGTGR